MLDISGVDVEIIGAAAQRLGVTVEPLKTNFLRHRSKCPCYRGFPLLEVIDNIDIQLR